MRPTLPAVLWYTEDRAGIVKWFTDLKPFAQNHGLSYFEFSGPDTGQGVDDDTAVEIVTKTRTNPDLNPMYATPAATVYGFR
jgi:hypothetical protein